MSEILLATPKSVPVITCHITARKFVSALNTQQPVILKCSSGCAVNVRETNPGWQVYGMGPFRVDSSICKAARVAGVIGDTGGVVTLVFAGQEAEFVPYAAVMETSFCFKGMKAPCHLTRITKAPDSKQDSKTRIYTELPSEPPSREPTNVPTTVTPTTPPTDEPALTPTEPPTPSPTSVPTEKPTTRPPSPSSSHSPTRSQLHPQPESRPSHQPVLPPTRRQFRPRDHQREHQHGLVVNGTRPARMCSGSTAVAAVHQRQSVVLARKATSGTTTSTAQWS